jgi:pyruvate dehydrogenase E2 component (dihydrolipoamide acetyltransferase)
MDVKLPNLGEGADSGTVVNLFVKEGDQIAKDQPILELENEKAVATIPSNVGGKVTKLYVKVGDKISVGQRLIALGDGDPAGPEASAAAPRPAKRDESVEREQAVPKPTKAAVEEPAPEPEAPGTNALPPAAAPSLRKAAREFGIDLTRVRGSGRGGRILVEDVRAYLQRLQRMAAQPKAAAPPTAAAASKPPPESIDFSKWGPVEKKAATPLRQVIARRMAENWNTVPHVTQFDNADITDLMAIRRKYVEVYEKKGAHLTLTSFALKIVADTLKKHEIFNASLDDASQEIVFKRYFHIGVAVDTEAGLIVPVIRDVDKKSVLQLSLELDDIAQRARDRKVSAEELKGGSFTISNQGGIGGAHFTPIVNKPEVAILGLGRGAMQAVVRDGSIQPRLLLPIGLSYDHRVIDGGAAARFTVDLVQGFQSFNEALLKL